MTNGQEPQIPWNFLDRLGRGVASESEVEAVTPWLYREGIPPPSYVLSRAVRIARQEAREESPGLLRRLAASLVFDSGMRPQLAGVRGRGGDARRLSYAADGFSGHLQTQAEPNGQVRVTGQLVADEPAGNFAVELRSSNADSVVASTPANEFGYFVLSGVFPGDYTLLARNETDEIEMRPLRIIFES